ncbi:MAG: hypothetical protein ACLU0A_13070 [Roseburia sp.]
MENTEKYRGTTSELDSEAIQKLYYEYQMTNQEIADMTWSTKANVNKVLIHGIKHYTSWFMEMLSEDDEKIFRKMLMYHKFSYWNEKQQRRYLIKNSRDGKICLIYFDEKCVKCMFDEFVPEDLKTLSIVEKMNIYNEMDYEVLKCSERDSILKKECILLNGDSKQLFKKAAHKRNMKGKEYAQFLGFESCLTEKDSIRDSRIIKFFEEHMVDGVVQLSSSPENQWIRNYAHRCGMHLDEFLDFYGYKKSRRADEYVSENKNIKYKKELSKYIIEPPNIVYFSSQDKIYQTIYNVAKLNEMSIDEYILSLGYVRSKKSNNVYPLCLMSDITVGRNIFIFHYCIHKNCKCSLIFLSTKSQIQSSFLWKSVAKCSQKRKRQERLFWRSAKKLSLWMQLWILEAIRDLT